MTERSKKPIARRTRPDRPVQAHPPGSEKSQGNSRSQRSVHSAAPCSTKAGGPGKPSRSGHRKPCVRRANGSIINLLKAC